MLSSLLQASIVIDGVKMTVQEAQDTNKGVLHMLSAAEPLQPAKIDMNFSAWLSTPTKDLVQDIIPADAWQTYWQMYQRNPIVLFNHDYEKPCGNSKAPQLVLDGETTGIYLGSVELADMPFNKEFLWPCIKNETLRQMSVGFLSLKGEYNAASKAYYHTLCYPLEGSVVSVACNPSAVIDQKHFERMYKSALEQYGMPDNLETIKKMLDAGVLKYPSELQQQHFVSGFKKVGQAEPTPEPKTEETIMYDITAPKSANVQGIPGSMDLAGRFAVKSEDTYMLPLKKENEAAYDKTCVLVSTKLFTTKLAGRTSAEDYKTIMQSLAKAYNDLGLSAPTLDNSPVFSAEDAQSRGSEIKWHNDESILVKAVECIQVLSEFTELNRTKSIESSELSKYVYASFDLWVMPHDEDDKLIIQQILDILIPSGSSESEVGPSMPLIEDTVGTDVEKTAVAQVKSPEIEKLLGTFGAKNILASFGGNDRI